MSYAPGPSAALPQLRGLPMVTDGGLETTLVFLEGRDLPHFAAFTLLDTPAGIETLHRYFESYVDIARRHGTGIVLETPTWRANPDWGAALGYDADRLAQANRAAVALLEDVRAANADVSPVVISGCIGPQGDGYGPDTMLGAEDAEAYHAAQIGTFTDAGVDLVTAITMTYAEEADGIVRAARTAGVPVAISFTVETDGRLPSGQSLEDAIAQVDRHTGGPDYYMVNCAHPMHFEHVLDAGAPWLARILGLRANASTKSHAELDEATDLDDGDPAELASAHRRLLATLPHLTVLGGCCGTDTRHVDAIAAAWSTA